jgi:hypothetical protein
MNLPRTRKDKTTPKLCWFVKNALGETYDGPFRGLGELNRCINNYRFKYARDPIVTQEVCQVMQETSAGEACRRLGSGRQKGDI